ncbi:BNR repeat-containing protein [Candidatus Sumerlaeota bacterium]|nr:BNR repeat-containing protein [Candidatus Sumerlaeota bacterium]
MLKFDYENACRWAAVFFALTSVAFSFPSVTKIDDTEVTTSALTFAFGSTYGSAINGVSFQQDMIITHNGWQYVAYYSGDRYVNVARRDLATSGSWENLKLEDYYFSGTDAHNVISMGICPNDGTIHLSFDHHGENLHYRVSQTGAATYPSTCTWSTDLFGAVTSQLISGDTIAGLTYPRFIQTPSGDLLFGYRYGASGSGDIYLVDYDGATQLWSNRRQVINRNGYYSDSLGSSTSRNAYMNSWTFGPDGNLHGTWCWRETAGGANHDLCHAFSDDGGVTWYNSDPPTQFGLSTNSGGTTQTLFSIAWVNSIGAIIGLATDDSGTQELIWLDSAHVAILELDRRYGLMNQQTQDVDVQGRIHTVMWHATDESMAYAVDQGKTNGIFCNALARHYHHYWRDDDGVWHHNELPGFAGSRPKLFIRDNGDAFLIYQSLADEAAVSALDNSLYFRDGDLTIQAATEASGWSDWQVIHVESGPFLNEMLGDYYRFKNDGVLSVMVQNEPSYSGESTPLRILDFQLSD